jgi:hypothetical protein
MKKKTDIMTYIDAINVDLNFNIKNKLQNWYNMDKNERIFIWYSIETY